MAMAIKSQETGKAISVEVGLQSFLHGTFPVPFQVIRALSHMQISSVKNILVSRRVCEERKVTKVAYISVLS